MEPQSRVDLRTFLLDFVEDRDRLVSTVNKVEDLVRLASEDARFIDLSLALACYDGRRGEPEIGMFNQDGLAFECRQALHDLGDHSHCVHGG